MESDKKAICHSSMLANLQDLLNQPVGGNKQNKLNEPEVKMGHAVDGRIPAPPGMYKTLVRIYVINYLSTG